MNRSKNKVKVYVRSSTYIFTKLTIYQDMLRMSNDIVHFGRSNVNESENQVKIQASSAISTVYILVS